MILDKKNIYIFAVFTCVGLIIFGALVVFPYVQDIFLLSGDIEEQKSNVENFNLREKNFKKIKSDEEEAKLVLSDLSESLVSEENGLEYIILLEEIARKTSNQQAIEIINDSKMDNNKSSQTESLDDPLENVNALRFKVRLEGSYKSLLQYLYELERLSIYTDVLSLNIKSGNVSLSSGSSPIESSAPTDIIKTTLEIRAFAK